jgi:hypothetical protein
MRKALSLAVAGPLLLIVNISRVTRAGRAESEDWKNNINIVSPSRIILFLIV